MRENFSMPNQSERRRSEHDANVDLAREAIPTPALVQVLLDQHRSLFQDGSLKENPTRDFLSEKFVALKATGLDEKEISQELERIFNTLLRPKN